MNILSLMPKVLYDTKMSPGRTLYLNHVGTQHKVVWSGFGWDNWDNESVAGSNIYDLGDLHGEFDAIVVYKGADLIGMEHVKIPKFVIFNEANDPNLVNKEIGEAAADVVVFHHEGDFNDRILDTFPLYTWTHGAPQTPEVAWEDKSLFSISTGCNDKSIYPVRSKATEAAKGTPRGHRDFKHPGYRLKDRWAVINQYTAYLKALSNSKISICCSSIYKYPLAKLFESAMCGCVVATDLPRCSKFEELLWPHCIQLEDSMSSARMRTEITSYSDDELREMGRKSREVAMEHFTYDQWSACLISAIQDVC